VSEQHAGLWRLWGEGKRVRGFEAWGAYGGDGNKAIVGGDLGYTGS